MSNIYIDPKSLKGRMRNREELLGIWISLNASRDIVKTALERDSYDFVWTDS